MVYVYLCPGCGHQFDVVKSVKEMSDVEQCPRCETTSDRQFMPQRVHFTKTKVEHPEYNPGLGCIVNNSDHRKELCKVKGVEEIGNEKPDSIHNYYDKKREEKRDADWAKVDTGWVGNGE